MATKLEGEAKLKREIRVYGVDLPVNVTLTANGLEFKVVGSKVGVVAPWTLILAKAAKTGENVPSKLHDQGYGFLQDAARRISAARIKRIDKKEAQ